MVPRTLKEMIYRWRESHARDRLGPEPASTVWRNADGIGFFARPSFRYDRRDRRRSQRDCGQGYQSPSGQLSCFLPLYATPELIRDTAINFKNRCWNWPMEAPISSAELRIWPAGFNQAGDLVQVVGQYQHTSPGSSRQLRSEQVIGGWLRGHFYSSAVWDLVVVPREQVSPERLAKVGGLAFSHHFNGFLAWGWDGWLGCSGLQPELALTSPYVKSFPESWRIEVAGSL